MNHRTTYRRTRMCEGTVATTVPQLRYAAAPRTDAQSVVEPSDYVGLDASAAAPPTRQVENEFGHGASSSTPTPVPVPIQHFPIIVHTACAHTANIPAGTTTNGTSTSVDTRPVAYPDNDALAGLPLATPNFWCSTPPTISTTDLGLSLDHTTRLA
ncbi:hypothetical protein H0H81_006101 [Sphagnurus paluster]|uniref:Uncharacterized protein n=1 Tax=Sphagnurus paluster TaxID=117069 RepID=A0A9P7KM23_9AGAR|nr:hypothetical protein H0H81_006101 [Sphagnurus paluster]